MAFSFFSQTTWCLIHCITGSVTHITQFPFVLGSGAGADLVLTPYPDLLPLHCALTQDKNNNVRLILKNPSAAVVLNGSSTTYAEIALKQDYTLQVPGHYFVLRGGDKKEVNAWAGGFRHTEWMLYDNQDQSSSPLMPLQSLLSWARAERKQPMSCVLFPTGADSGFHLAQFPPHPDQAAPPAPVPPPGGGGPPPYSPPLQQVRSIPFNGLAAAVPVQPQSFPLNGHGGPGATAPANGFALQPPISLSVPGAGSGPVPQMRSIPAPASMSPAPHVAASVPAFAAKPAAPVDAGDVGEYTCPTCWLRFDAEDVMHVAMHDSLRGDPILGEDAPQRFHATAFNTRGQALDAMGIPCFDTACPHCRSKFPPSFLQTQHHIFSVVGNASAGKTYFLAVLAKVLPAVAYRHLNLTWQDADPGANASLNDMRDRLFGASSPETAALDKTQIGNATTYQNIPRHGKVVQMPKPFSFHVVSRKDEEKHATVIFYDNAGEHFRPNVRIEDSPGALHVASASALFFLFDPINNTEFRQRLRGQSDPQLENPITSDMQDVILSEIRARIARLGHLSIREKSSKPLAVMVGKSDAWQHLLPEGAFLRPAIVNGTLHLPNLRHNSTITRELLLDSSPAIVANSEALSSRVLFFPVSTFGHTPKRVKREDGTAPVAPDPAQLRPQFVEAPILWALNHLSPGLIPVTDDAEAAVRST